VAVLASENRSSTWCAECVCAEGVIESNALFSQSIDVGSFVDLAAVRRDSVGGVIVRHDVQNIRARTQLRLQSVINEGMSISSLWFVLREVYVIEM